MLGIPEVELGGETRHTQSRGVHTTCRDWDLDSRRHSMTMAIWTVIGIAIGAGMRTDTST
jgi:hypothetical protein